MVFSVLLNFMTEVRKVSHLTVSSVNHTKEKVFQCVSCIFSVVLSWKLWHGELQLYYLAAMCAVHNYF